VIGRSRVAAAATSRTAPRTTVPGQATFRPLARRSWYRYDPKNCSRSLLVRGNSATS
jgi:hypothetical protein